MMRRGGRARTRAEAPGAAGPGRGRRRSWAGTLAAALALGTACAAVVPRGPAPVSLPPEKPTPPGLTGLVERYEASEEDTLVDLAVEHDLGYVEIVSANPGIDPWLPGEGTEILLPKAHVFPTGPREGIVVNVPEQRLYFYPERGAPLTFPIGVGREGWETPLGTTEVLRKQKNPTWYPGPGARAEDPSLGRAVPPGEDNPLGTRAIYLGIPGYLIHGTNQPYGVGRRSSRGCIRLYPRDIEQLYSQVPIGTPVRLVNEEIKLGWFQEELYLEVHPNLDQATELEETGNFTPTAPPEDLAERIRQLAGERASQIDWDAVQSALAELRGIPTRITDSGRPAARTRPGGLRWLRSLLGESPRP